MDAIVRCNAGLLQGTEEEGVMAFKGVPFAAPPIDALRFRRPRPCPAWSGVRSASMSGPAAWQINASNAAKVQQLLDTSRSRLPGVRPGPPFAGITYAQPSISEDCLYLDMWIPERRADESLPVYVYFHGGGNAGSAGSLDVERGATLAREERVIIVRPNYRLGALGWVHFGLIDGALPEACNLGVQDQLAALRWVFENIEAFGGDARNIAVGGESAGATAVSHVLVNPDARKLVRRAVLQSFTPFHQWSTQTPAEAAQVARLYFECLGIDDGRALLTIDPDRLLAAAGALQRHFPIDRHCAWRPLGAVVDGDVVPELPAARLCEGRLADTKLDVMIGFAKDEWQFFYGHTPEMRNATAEDFARTFAQVSRSTDGTRLLAAYRAIYPERDAARLLSDALSFEFFKLPALRMAANLSRQGVRTHVFHFAYELPGQGGYLRACHTLDMPFIWRNLGSTDLARWPAFEGVDVPTAKRAANDFGTLFGRFLRGEEPGPAWPSYDDVDRAALWFGQQVHPRAREFDGELAAFAQSGIADVRELESRLACNARSTLTDPTAPIATDAR